MQRLIAMLATLVWLTGSASAAEIIVGAQAPLSGPQAVFGVTLQNGMKMYFDEVNKAGGAASSTFKLVQMDDKADPREGTLIAQKFCDDNKVLFALGPFNSGVAQATLPIYSDCGMPQIILGSNPRLTQQGYKTLFRPIGNDFAQGVLPAEYARNTLKVSKAAVVHDKQVFGQGVADIFAQKFAELGGTVVSASAVNPTDVDFTVLITQLKSQAPEIVYLGAVMPQLSLFARQMKEQGLNARLFVPDGGYVSDFIEQAGKAAAQGSLVSTGVPPMDANSQLVAFAKAYKEKYNGEVGPYSIYGYVFAQIVVEAVKKANRPDRATFVETLRSVQLQTAIGPIAFESTGELKVAPMFLYEVSGDTFKLAASSK
jgi:branched-chain amino acid transport system substrate-binding protein